MRDVVLRVCKQHTKQIAQVPVPGSTPVALTRLRLDREASRERTRAELQNRFAAVQHLARQGMRGAAITRALGFHRHTVQKYLASDTAPERRHTTRKARPLTPYQGYVRERWQGNCRNARQVWREIVAQGYPGAYENVARLTGYLRQRVGAGQPLPRTPAGRTPAGATGMVLMRPEKQSTDEQHALAHLRGLHPDLAAPLALFTSFAVVLRERAVKEPTAQRDQWMTDAASSEVAEMRAFATKLRQNRGAAVAALTLPYSQGQTEGRVTKLKRVKRAMYGRATFDLLRQRVLYATT